MLHQDDQRHEHNARYRFSARASFFVVRFASISHLIHHGICMSGSRVIAPDIALAVSHNCPVGDQQAARPESKLWWSAAPLPSLRVSPVGQQRHCHTVRSMVTFFLFSFSQASRAKSVVALARRLQLQQSTVSTCTIQLCTGLDSCHVLGAYTHLIQDLGNLGNLLVSSDTEQI